MARHVAAREDVAGAVLRLGENTVTLEIICSDSYAAIATHDALFRELKAGQVTITLSGVPVASDTEPGLIYAPQRHGSNNG